MTELQLRAGLKSIAEYLGDAEVTMEVEPKLEAGIRYGGGHYYTSRVSDPFDIYWMICYQIIRDGNMEAVKAHEIFKTVTVL